MSLIRRLVIATLPLAPRSLVRRAAQRYVAGETLEQAVDVVRDLNGHGAMATMDLLGEEVKERAAATAAVEEYIRIFDVVERERLSSNVSIKLTLLGLKIDESFCLESVDRIAAAAKAHGNFVRIDMEDATTTDATLRIYQELQRRHGNLGVALQAYMRRTLADIDALPQDGANVRLCKGIYIEPRSIAYKGYETVRVNFVAALEKLLQRGIYVGIATHDEYLVCAALALIDRLGVPADRFEFQMLLGVDAEMRRILIAAGHRMRIYVPYGRHWERYSIRRVRENPEIALQAARAFLRRGPSGAA